MPLVSSAIDKRLYLMGLSELTAIASFMRVELGRMETNKLNEGTLLLVDQATSKIVQEVTKQKVYPDKINWASVNSEKPQNRIIPHKLNIWYGDKDLIMVGTNPYHLVTMVTKKDILFHLFCCITYTKTKW